MLTHTERFCKKKFDASSENVNRELGSWLRAPPRRVAGAPKSKWLREEGDGDWNLRYGKDNSQQQNGEGSIPNFTHAGNQMWNKQDCMADLSGAIGGSNLNSKIVGGNNYGLDLNGPEEEELDGLNLEERKRRRSEAHVFNGTGLEKEKNTMEPGLSTADCPDSQTILLAKLTQQASQS